MQKECRNCGNDAIVTSEDGYRITRTDVQFCSTTCKNEYHNNIRKAHRKIASIDKSLRELDAIYQKYQDNPNFRFIIEARDRFI
jgi:hypothetical protein